MLIKLRSPFGNLIALDSDDISEVVQEGSRASFANITSIYLKRGIGYLVQETVDEILELIKAEAK